MENFNKNEFGERQDETFESLCCVEGIEGYSIRRLADVDPDGDLRPFERGNERFAFPAVNHFYNDGTFAFGSVGIIRWKAETNPKNPDEPIIRLEASQETPIVVCPTPSTSNVKEVKERLKVGAPVSAAGNVRTLFIPSQTYQHLVRGATYVEGALCSLDECERENVDGETLWRLKPETASLPIYKITSQQTLDLKCLNAQYRFLSLNLGTPIKHIDVKTTKEIVLDVARESWATAVNAAKDIVGGDKTDLEKCLNNMPAETIVEKIACRCDCSVDEAEKYWEETRLYVDGWLKAENEDIKAFVALLERNDEERERYRDFWLDRLWDEVDKEDEKTKARRDAAEKELRLLLEEKKRLEAERDALKAERNRLREEASSASRTLQASANDGGARGRTPLFASGGAFRPIETDKREKNSAEILAQNLKRRVQSDFYKELAAFLVAAVERREPLILAGPCCERIVDALAAACGGRRSGTLVCDGDWDGNAVAQAEDGDDEIVLVKNALHPRWVDRWPNAVAESSKSWILTTPFVEDLTLLPVGFYNYFAPLLTELLVDGANGERKPLIAGKNVEFFRGGEKKDAAFEVEGQSFAKMRASAFYVKRLTTMLRRARQIGTETLKFDATSQTSLTLLCGVAPFALATGNLDVLRETFQWEKTGLDAKCRETISRLLGDGDE